MTPAELAPGLPRSATDVGLRVVTAAALAVDAVIHVQLAAGYDNFAPAGIGMGNLFRIEAVVAVLVGLAVLWNGRRLAYAGAFAVALSAVAAVVLYRYVDVPAFGPIPAMYEPVWFTEKTLTAVAEGLATVTAALGYRRAKRLRYRPSTDT